MTKPGDFATSDDIGSLNVILRDTAGAYVAAGGGGGGGGGDASAANQTTGNASLAAIDTNAGATTDAAVTTNTTGTLSGKVRGLVKLLIDLIAKTPALGTAGTAAADVITVQGIASGTAQAVSGTVTANAGTGTLAVSGPVTDTQLRATAVPVSGTVTANAGTGTLAVSAAALPLPSGAATLAKQPALGTAGSAAADVITVQGIASGTVIPVSDGAGSLTVDGTVTANAGTGNFGTNLAQVAGTTTDTNSGTKSAGTQRVVIATDQPAMTNAQPANVTQLGGTTVDTNSGSKSAGTLRVVLATDQPQNTTALKVDASATTQPVSGTVSNTPPTYTAPASGELQGVTSATQLPSVACKMVQFVAAAANTGKVYLGPSSGVTKVDGTTDTTTGLQLSPGASSGWLPLDNLNRLYRICDNTTDHLTYLAMN